MQSVSVLAVLAVAFSCALAFDATLDQYWNLWKQANNKGYSNVEEQVRRTIWESNLQLVRDHNLKADLGVHSFWLGMNKFADLTTTEFVKMMNGYNASLSGSRKPSRQVFKYDPNLRDLPDSVDWRTQGYVTPIKDQGQCGSCWAFSTTGSLEGQHFKATGKLVSLSEQNLVDCSSAQGNMGCNGGLMDQAFDYIKVNDGIDTEDSYPYEAVDDTCRFNKANVGATDTGYTDIQSKDENALQQAVLQLDQSQSLLMLAMLHFNYTKLESTTNHSAHKPVLTMVFLL
jgi:cathepsin L